MNDTFYERVVLPAEEADRFIQETGSLPEIKAAAEGLLKAVAQTRAEIAEAKFAASRFPTELTPFQKNMEEIVLKNASPGMRQARETEGEAGMKRFSLESWLTTVEGDIFGLLHELAEIRTDLIVSQQEI